MIFDIVILDRVLKSDDGAAALCSPSSKTRCSSPGIIHPPYDALPIVSLVSLLVGLILAFMGAIPRLGLLHGPLETRELHTHTPRELVQGGRKLIQGLARYRRSSVPFL